MDNRDRINLRLADGLSKAIEAACKQRPGKVSMNTWINEAIQEKLAKDDAADNQQVRRRKGASHG